MNMLLAGLLLFLLSALSSDGARAGVLVAPGLKWSVFSFEPEEQEDTPNYQGITGELKFGYSFRQIFDLAALANYTAGNPGMVKVPDDNANFVFYGGELAARIHKAVYFAIRGGSASYQLLKLGGHADEVLGHWAGPGFGFSLGAFTFFERSKTSGLQVSLDMMQTTARKLNAVEGETSERRLQQFSIGFTYVFNGYHNAAIENSPLSSYLNTFIFWE